MASQTEGKPEWFLPVWQTKCFLRSEWERAENWLFPNMYWKVKVMKLWCHGLQCIIVCVWSQSSSSTKTTSRCRNCTWQSKGWHSSYFIYNLLILTKNLMESCERFCPTNSFLFHVLKCLLWETPSWASSRQTNERLFHKMLRVDVFYQLFLLTEAPHTVAALKQLSFRPRWLSFIYTPVDQGMISNNLV